MNTETTDRNVMTETHFKLSMTKPEDGSFVEEVTFESPVEAVVETASAIRKGLNISIQQVEVKIARAGYTIMQPVPTDKRYHVNVPVVESKKDASIEPKKQVVPPKKSVKKYKGKAHK